MKLTVILPRLLLVSVFASLLWASPVSAYEDTTVVIGGETIDFEISPQNLNSRLLVQIRPIAEKLGCDVEWDGETNTQYINQKGVPIEKTAQDGNEIKVYVNNKSVVFPDQPPVMVQGYVMVPSRPVAEALGYVVSWDQETLRQTISQKQDETYLLNAPSDTTVKNVLTRQYVRTDYYDISFEYDKKSSAIASLEGNRVISLGDSKANVSIRMIPAINAPADHAAEALQAIYDSTLDEIKKTHRIEMKSQTDITIHGKPVKEATFTYDKELSQTFDMFIHNNSLYLFVYTDDLERKNFEEYIYIRNSIRFGS